MADIVVRLQDFFYAVFFSVVESSRFWPSVAFLVLILLVALHRRSYRFTFPRRLVESAGASGLFYLMNILFAPMVFLIVGLVDYGYAKLNIPRVDPSFWNGVPTWLLMIMAILAYDFANYWNHRVMHMRWLWPVHAIHHSDPDVNGLTTYRIHFLEVFVMAASYILLLSWLGISRDAMGYGAVFVGLHNIYVHLDLDWSHGPFRHILASPRFHRWHHADLPKAYGKNLANVFPFFDVLFGTYWVPGPCKEEMGAAGVPKNDVVKLMLFPFAEWARLVRSGFVRYRRRKHEASASELLRAPAE